MVIAPRPSPPPPPPPHPPPPPLTRSVRNIKESMLADADDVLLRAGGRVLTV